jgi:hypothetical protein
MIAVPMEPQLWRTGEHFELRRIEFRVFAGWGTGVLVNTS